MDTFETAMAKRLRISLKEASLAHGDPHTGDAKKLFHPGNASISRVGGIFEHIQWNESCKKEHAWKESKGHRFIKGMEAVSCSRW